MTDLQVCEVLSSKLGELFLCTPHGKYQRIRTPFLYPDGDYIDLFCEAHDGQGWTVGDLGETTRWLRMQTTSPRRSPKQQTLIEDIVVTHGVEFYKGMLLARCKSADELAATLTRVAQAALRVADLWFTFRTRSVQSVTDEVADFLAEEQVQFDRGERLVGRSGRIWPIDFHVRTVNRSSLVLVLATGARSAARAIAEHAVATWYDLNQLTVGPEALHFVSLFDDTSDVWSAEDFRLVEGLSEIATWSKPEGFTYVLQAA